MYKEVVQELDGWHMNCCIVLPANVWVVEITHKNRVLLSQSLFKWPKYCFVGPVVLVLRFVADAYCKIPLGKDPSDLGPEAKIELPPSPQLNSTLSRFSLSYAYMYLLEDKKWLRMKGVEKSRSLAFWCTKSRLNSST